jgi:hypothetical protein
MEVKQTNGDLKASVLITGYQQPNVLIVPTASATEKQKRILKQWLNDGSF